MTVDVKLYSHRWKRWLSPEPRNMDSNRASPDQDLDPEEPEEPEGFPGLLSAEDTQDNSSQIEVCWLDSSVARCCERNKQPAGPLGRYLLYSRRC